MLEWKSQHLPSTWKVRASRFLESPPLFCKDQGLAPDEGLANQHLSPVILAPELTRKSGINHRVHTLAAEPRTEHSALLPTPNPVP